MSINLTDPLRPVSAPGPAPEAAEVVELRRRKAHLKQTVSGGSDETSSISPLLSELEKGAHKHIPFMRFFGALRFVTEVIINLTSFIFRPFVATGRMFVGLFKRNTKQERGAFLSIHTVRAGLSGLTAEQYNAVCIRIGKEYLSAYIRWNPWGESYLQAGKRLIENEWDHRFAFRAYEYSSGFRLENLLASIPPIRVAPIEDSIANS